MIIPKIHTEKTAVKYDGKTGCYTAITYTGECPCLGYNEITKCRKTVFKWLGMRIVFGAYSIDDWLQTEVIE